MTTADLTSLARQLATTPDRRLGSTRSIAAALLLRQALEATLDRWWADTEPGLESCSARAQLLSLPSYLDAPLAGEVTYCWYRLSSICHHHAYELRPAPTELEHLVDIVERLSAVVLTRDEPGQGYDTPLSVERRRGPGLTLGR